MNPIFVGKVSYNIFFGTKFDDINVPYTTNLIYEHATRMMRLEGQVVWQTTYLSSIRINVVDYQDIVGAQYVEVFDDGTSNHGSHWYTVQGYQQVSRKTVELTLLYDPLLSIGIEHISGINGVMKRWTVSDDSHFNYIFSSEPINQIDNYEYSYFRYNPTTRGLINICGFPYDMTQPPNILEYINQAGGSTNIYYPDMSTPERDTNFISSTGEGVTIIDGLSYYLWQPTAANNKVYKTYNYAVSLGHDLAINAYSIPNSDMITMTTNDDGLILNVYGQTKNVPTNFALYDSGYNNNKAAELGVYFTLYNEITGDSTTCPNEDLTNTNITITVNPYATGTFYARFNGYYKDTNGYSGLIKSAGFPPFSISSSAAVGGARNYITNQMAQDESYTNFLNNANTLRNQSEIADRNEQWDNGINALLNVFSSLGNLSPGGVFDAAYGDWFKVLQNYYNTNSTISTNLENLLRTRNIQQQMLNTQGNLGQIMPPHFKYAGTYALEGSAYTFCVRRTTLSPKDRQRADRFFTAYGYNVDNEMLTNVSQLANRQRFTFIMADNVNITSVYGGTDLTRLRDFQTIQVIQDRFSSGLRIWKTNPDYDWASPNPII